MGTLAKESCFLNFSIYPFPTITLFAFLQNTCHFSLSFSYCTGVELLLLYCIYFCFIDYGKAFDSVEHNKMWKILKEMGIPDHLICLLRNLYEGQEKQLELDIEQTDSKLGKEYIKAACCHPVYLTYKQSTLCKMPRLDEAQAGIKIAGRNINNLRYTDDTALTAENEEEPKSLLMKVKEDSEKVGLNSTFSDTCTPVFIAALFIIARTWKQSRCASADEWIRNLW